MRVKSGWYFYLLNLRAGTRSFIKSIDYFRFREYLMAIKEINSDLDHPGEAGALDVGCGEELFGIFLAKTNNSSEVTAIDRDQGRISLQMKYFRRLSPGCRNFKAELADAVKMPQADNTFDLVTCFAVLPLIEGEGDIGIAKEIGRVLRPGGKAYITVGYGKDYKEQRDAAGARGFSRIYDEPELRKRIIGASGLELEKRMYFGEPGVKFSRFWFRLPFIIKLPFRWITPLFTLAFLKSINPKAINETNMDKVDGVFLVLKKGRGV
ncbi:class I SAM-dependent methyltransferase [bacterium]|nr:MAG: class I SAM-dependent methyltransferase [bacterium]